MANFQHDPVDYSELLRSHMTQSGIASYRALSQASGVSRSAIDRLRRGQVGQLRLSTLQRLSHTLGVPLGELVEAFDEASLAPSSATATQQLKALRQECDRLRTQLTTQAETLRQQVQQEALGQLESWLVQWPTAVYAAQQKPDLPAQKLIPLVRPVEVLVQRWGVTAIETVGAEVSFDPQIHQPNPGAALQPGDPVRVSHGGCRQGDRLLHRARVTPIDG
jgi:transcriptional regulator with XRE-family HTH domain